MTDTSIIIPIYNTKPEYFSQALNSIQIQDTDLQNIEVSVHDDGSKPCLSEQYQKIIREHPISNIIYSRDVKNRGVGYARNCAASNACGEYLLFLDSDDVLHESAVRTLNEVLEKNKWADASYSDNIKFTYPEVDLYQYRHKYLYNKYARLFKGTAYNPIIRDTYALSTIYIRKHVFESLNGYADSADIGEQSEFLPRLHERSNHHNLAYVPRTLYFRRHLTESLSRRKRDELHNQIEQFLHNAAERTDLDVSKVEHFGRVSPHQVSHYMFYDSDGECIIPPYLNAQTLCLTSSNRNMKTDHYWEKYIASQVCQHLRRVQTK